AGTEEVVFGEVGGSILLLCRNVSKEATEVVWFQGDPHSFPPLFSSRIAFPPDVRFSLVNNSSLHIRELRVQDEGNYTCKEVLNKTNHEHRVQLLVARTASSFSKVLFLAGAVLWLRAGSTNWCGVTPMELCHEDHRQCGDLVLPLCLYVYLCWIKLWQVSPPRLVCVCRAASCLIPLSCCSELGFPGAMEHRSGNPPHSSPKCWAETSSSGLNLQLFCSWPGGHPHPTLHWREEGHNLENSSSVISSVSNSDTHVETLNSSHLSHHKVFKCIGSHVTKQKEPACTVEIKVPSLASEAPKTCFVGDNVTLTCRVTESTPAARLTWLWDIAQPEVEIQSGGRYLITQEGNISRLTIQNCSQDTDGGCYICKAQNPVGMRELFICLTVKQPVNIVGVVGAVVVLSLLVILTVTGVFLYYNPLLCLRAISACSAVPRNQESEDILVLVDSDGDEGKGEEE
ncbi:VSI10 protein, partial [Rhinopomastus cyanomelas]|nr:VSI10 protein [Rhinopomastus cyanomelas]